MSKVTAERYFAILKLFALNVRGPVAVAAASDRAAQVCVPRLTKSKSALSESEHRGKLDA